MTAGRAVRFFVQVGGVPLPQVTWYKDSQALTSSDTCKFLHDDEEHTLMLLDISPEDASVYSCEARNEYGEATSSASLTIEGMFQHFKSNKFRTDSLLNLLKNTQESE